MTTTTTTIGYSDLESGKWYRVVNRDSRYVIYPKPGFDNKPSAVLPVGQPFMFIRAAPGEDVARWKRYWVQIGTSDLFGYVQWNGGDMEFEKVEDSDETHMPELR
jgi:hypothetical protein